MAVYLTAQMDLFYDNGILLGEVYCEIDGYYVFIPKIFAFNRGYWSEHLLIEIANLLGLLNEYYDKDVQRYFNKETK